MNLKEFLFLQNNPQFLSGFSRNLKEIEPLDSNFEALLSDFSNSENSNIVQIEDTKFAFLSSPNESISYLDKKKKDENPKQKEEKIDALSLLPHSFILQPLNPTLFIQKLPTILKAFIKEIVQIVKVKNQEIYQFTFSKLNLDITVQNKDNILFILIKTQDKKLAKVLTSKEEGLLQYLREVLLKDKVVLKIHNEEKYNTNEMPNLIYDDIEEEI
jgi:hypothetical protein